MYVKSRKTEYHIKCRECPPHAAMHAFSLFLVFDATNEEFFRIVKGADCFINILLLKPADRVTSAV
jgi:hypothetical protein